MKKNAKSAKAKNPRSVFSMDISKRCGSMRGEAAFDMHSRIIAVREKGIAVKELHMGQPDFFTPEKIKGACIEAINLNQTGYTPTEGLWNLRKAVAQYITTTRGVAVSPEEALISPGGKPGMYVAIMSTINPGDEVIYPDPGYPPYESHIRMAGALPVPIQLKQENGFKPDLGEFEALITRKTKAIILNSPNNPTGSVLSHKDLEHIATIAIENDLFIISDEPYDQLLFDSAKHQSIYSLPGMKGRTILSSGFSKTFSMTGWRLGYVIAPKHIVSRMAKYAMNIWSCPTNFVQLAGIVALTKRHPETKKMVGELQKRRDYVVDALNNICGVECSLPAGAFFAFPDIRKALASTTIRTGLELEYAMLEGLAELASRENKGAAVSILDGTRFGAYGNGFIRISFSGKMSDIREGVTSLKEVLEGELEIPRRFYSKHIAGY